ncbi:MAG: multicopper oxidase domain-containing protein [Micropruina sp.]|nr:multicopper oxidase domain-containing protein [Micropruina sp.]
MFSRRAFFKYSGGSTLALYVLSSSGESTAFGQPLPGGTLTPASISKFVSPLTIPPVMPRVGRVLSGGRLVDYYKIGVREIDQQMLPSGLPKTKVWGYGAVVTDVLGLPLLKMFSSPSLTIEATAGTPVRVKWLNELVDGLGKYRPHLLPVDPTLHWANPGRLGSDRTDSRPDLTGKTYVPTDSPTDSINGVSEYTRYWGPVPLVTHVHGAVGVGDESDGYPEAWTLPAALNIPTGYARRGTWSSFFANKALQLFGGLWGTGYATTQYPNENRASTIWYHDHTLGLTRQNVYAGLAGFFIIRGGSGGDAMIQDARTNLPAVLPGPAPTYGSISTSTCRDIPIAIQDRSFNSDGSLFYPDTRSFFDGNSGPYVPASETPPIWNPEFFGNALVVNGRTWPYRSVERRRYRFRMLNGCQSRFLILDFSSIPGVSVWQIGNDGGLLKAPVDLSTGHGNRLLIIPAERADLIVDFTNVPVGSYTLRNVGPDEQYGGGVPGVDFATADPTTTGSVMQFRVVSSSVVDSSTPARYLRLPSIPAFPGATVTRRLVLMEHGHGGVGPTAAVLGIVRQSMDPASPQWDGIGTGHAVGQMWSDQITTNPAVGATEVWEFYNMTVDAHPVHVHEVVFEVLNRQAIDVDMHEVALVPGSTPISPKPWERGRKDTVLALPGEVTRIKATFTRAGQYVWHCHILEHEDNEMMLPFRIGPRQTGQPG